MKYMVIIVTILFCCGCEKEVRREYGESVISTVTRECTYYAPGYCMDCGLSIDGKYDCMSRFKLRCSQDGQETVKVKITPFVIFYESGNTRSGADEALLETIMSCR